MSRAIKILIIILLGIIALACFTVVFYQYKKAKKIVPPIVSQPVTNPVKSTVSLSAVGIIQAINGQTIVFKAPGGSNSAFSEDKIFTVTIDDKTEILENNGPVSLNVTSNGEGQDVNVEIKSQGANNEGLQTAKKLTLADLKVGAWALFISDKNLLGTNSFIAQKIYYLTVKQ